MGAAAVGVGVFVEGAVGSGGGGGGGGEADDDDEAGDSAGGW